MCREQGAHLRLKVGAPGGRAGDECQPFTRRQLEPFDAFPWFREASIGQLSRIERPTGDHLHWPDLDVDLTLDGIEHPDAYPLVSRARSNSA
jgi:hypothetical protein